MCPTDRRSTPPRRPSPVTTMRMAAIAVLACLHGTAATSWAVGPDLELQPGDHVCIIGNTLADRMQHDGWLEAHLQARFPKHELVVRNLGFSGDELSLRLRSANFGSPDLWLSFTKADVVFAFFGYNESFAGPEGIGKFKKDLDDFIKHTLAQRYNGEGAPKLVLFSPIAHEDLHDRNLPDGAENNKRLELYTAAMAEAAAGRRRRLRRPVPPHPRPVRQGDAAARRSTAST